MPLRQLVTFAILAALTASPALAQKTVPFSIPSPQTIPAGPLGDAIREGQSIMNTTKAALPANVGNGLNCSSCHLNAGTVPNASPFVGIWGAFPAYFTRSGAVETLADRINDCFRRSMNGTVIAVDGLPMRAMLAYISWLSTGVPTGSSVEGRGFLALAPPSRPPDAGRGATLYEQRCAACHGKDGGGTPGPGGTFVMPPLWGPQSFNDGAGMSHIATAAAFIHAKMPLGQGGSLPELDAWDIAALVVGAPRPVFNAKATDFPKGAPPR